MSTVKNETATTAKSATKNNTELYELFLDGIQDIYWAESHLVKALPKMIKAASSETLKSGIQSHLEETQNHVTRLEQVFASLDEKAKAKTCAAMKGILEEATELLSETKGMNESVVDVAILMACQKVEHYEIASYGSLIGVANAMGETEVANLLNQTIQEEVKASTLLQNVAEKEVNKKAVNAN